MCQGVPTHWHRRGVPSDFMRAFAPVTREKRGTHLRFSGTHLVVDLPQHTPQRHRGMLGPPPLVPPPPKSPHMSHGPHRVAGVRLCAPIAVDFTALCLAGRWTSLTSRGRPLARSAELEAADMRNVHGGVCDGTACRYFSAQHALYCASTRGDVIAVVSMGTRWCRFLFRDRSVCSRTLQNGSCLDSTAQDSLN